MRTSELLLSSLDITEDEYNFKGQFILSTPGKTRSVDMEEIETDVRLKDISDFFGLEEEPRRIRQILMEMVMEKANICSSIVEGETF